MKRNATRKTAALAAAMTVLACLAAPVMAASYNKEYQDKGLGYSITVPGDWYYKDRGGSYLVRFSDRAYEAFVMLDLVYTDEDIRIDENFERFVDEQNGKVERTVSSFKVIRNRAIKINGGKGYQTDAVFRSGPNTVSMSIYYIPVENKVFMLSTMCPEDLLGKWGRTLDAVVASFSAEDD